MTQEPRKHPADEDRPSGVQDEGAYIAERGFQGVERSFAESERRETRKRRGAAYALEASEFDPHADENHDRELDETFPASDPISIAPGAD